jgi:hypothetical protein
VSDLIKIFQYLNLRTRQKSVLNTSLPHKEEKLAKLPHEEMRLW